MQQIICAWCQKVLGWKKGSGVTHGICPTCKKKQLEEVGK